MPRWSKTDTARIEKRRLHVEQLSARGLGLYEILDELERMGVINPENSKPYSVATVSRDLAELEQRWRDEAIAERDKHKGQQLKELRSARRAAWKAQDYGEVRRSIETEMKLLGTEAPSRLEHSGADGGPIRTEDVSETRARLLADIERRLEEVATRGTEGAA